ncbi:MAG TPA: hypothetical protein VIL95_07765 [Bacillota bacterium]
MTIAERHFFSTLVEVWDRHRIMAVAALAEADIPKAKPSQELDGQPLGPCVLRQRQAPHEPEPAR